MSNWDDLFETLSQRRRMESVCLRLLPVIPEFDLPRRIEKQVQELARAGTSYAGYTSMPETFRAAQDFSRQLGIAQVLFADLKFSGAGEIGALDDFLRGAAHGIGNEYPKLDFKADRLNREQRSRRGIELSNHQYNRRFRFLSRVDKKRVRFVKETLRCDLQRVAKSRLAFAISKSDATQTHATLAFLAYYTARCNRRSVFTSGEQERPYDEIAHALFSTCQADPKTSWWAIAHVYPDPRVLEHLSDAAKGQLLGLYTAWLYKAAELLKDTWSSSQFDRREMIVRRGNDSSTWNGAAGAWNKIRDGWLNLVHDLGLQRLLGEYCPGKVMRVIAADVAEWHRSQGKSVSPDTKIWASLPLPWHVLDGSARCTESDIRLACTSAGVRPEDGGWLIPRTHGIQSVTPTPELVHGVAVANPHLATALRNAGVFSGKAV